MIQMIQRNNICQYKCNSKILFIVTFILIALFAIPRIKNYVQYYIGCGVAFFIILALTSATIIFILDRFLCLKMNCHCISKYISVF